jgi:hypothetical protein
MDTTSKLIDIVIGWSKQGKRWPLLLILLVPAYFVFFQNYYGIEFRQVFENRPFVWFSTVTIVLSILLYLLLDNYNRIAYSRIMDAIRKGPRISVTKPLA